MGQKTRVGTVSKTTALLAISKAACGAGLRKAPIEAKTGFFPSKIRIDSWMSMELSK